MTILPRQLTAIIPARNEAGRIGHVLAALRQVPQVDEIIVVDDGSSDSTSAEVTQAAQVDARIRLIRHEKNRGKGQSLFDAWRTTHSTYILMLDADLIGLQPQHIIDLIQPVLSGQTDMTMGLFKGGDWRTDFSHWITPWLTGQRCLRSEFFEILSEEAAQGYGFETALTAAAQKQGWRGVRVWMRGVSHPPSEYHRGFVRGALNRMRMYLQIGRAWMQAKARPSKVHRHARRIIIAILAAILLASVMYNDSTVRASLTLTDMQPLPLYGVQRLLVVAPHPDDETLGPGGLIQIALAQGTQVRVVLMTNGDGEIAAPLVLDKIPLAKPKDYIYIGTQRQAESLAALQKLGLPASQVDFLGYPDGGTYTLWLSDWQTECPMRARLTAASDNPYKIAYDPKVEYCGSSVVKDLQSILSAYRPDMIVVSHPNDHHPDHRAAYNFTAMAVDLLHVQDPAYDPQVLGYLVHYGSYPQPRGLNPSLVMLPPHTFSTPGNIWTRVDLTPAQEDTKLAALQKYQTQQHLMAEYLLSFVRQNELFAALPAMDLSTIDLAQMPLRENGLSTVSTPLLPEPGRANIDRLAMSGADLVSWQAVRVGNSLWLSASARGSLLHEVNYQFVVKTPDGKTRTYLCNDAAVQWGARTFTAQLDLAELGNPPVLAFSAEAKQKITLDHTAWHFLRLVY